MRSVLMSVVVAVVVVAPGLAHAQHAPSSKLWIGGGFGISPVGTLKVDTGNGNTLSRDPATAFQLNGLLDYRVTPLVSIGFAPGLILNVKASDADSSGTELDLPIRIAVGAPIAPKIRLYGFASPGYSVLFPPSGTGGGNPSGFMLGFGGGLGFHVAPRVMLTAELGYQFRFQSSTQTLTIAGQTISFDVSSQVNYLTFAFGIAAAI